MAKSKYRAVPVKRFEVERLQNVVQADSPLVFAVDVAKTKNKAAITQRGQPLAMIGWTAPAETMDVVALVEKLGKLSHVEVVMESTGTYGDPLRGQMARIGVPVFQVRTTLTNESAEIFDHVPSMHDGKAAQVVGWLHDQRRSREWKLKPDQERDLAAIVEVYDVHDRALTDCLNRVEAKVARHFPELTTCVDLTNASTLALLERYGSPALIAKAGREACDHMCKVGGPLLDRTKAEAVIEAARSTTGLPMTFGELATVKMLATEALRQRRLKAESGKQLEALGDKFDPIKQMASVIGKATAAVVYSEASDPGSYSSPAAYVKALGLNLKEKSSGDHIGELKLTKRGSPLARKWLFMATLRLIQNDPLFAAWYARKLARDGGKAKLKATTALMRKLASALWHVARGAAFDSKRLFDARQLGLAN
jgi:transposase